MSHHPRIEELSSSSPSSSASDPSDMDPTDLFPPPSQSQSLSHPSSQTQTQPPPSVLRPQLSSPPPTPQLKSWACLYPLYFDASRSRAHGRRVSASLAVPNPLARDIVDAAQAAGFDARSLALEPAKTHPKDWANPGRVRVALRREGTGAGTGRVNPRVENKHHLYILIATYLRAHPTTSESPKRLRIQGLPVPEGPLPEPVKPRGWRMGTVLPMHSPAVSGGGVSENMLKEMMQEMQGGAGGGQETIAGGGGEGRKKKKEKKGRGG